METKNTFLMYMAGVSLKGKWGLAIGAFLFYLFFIGWSQFTIHYHHYLLYLALLIIEGPVVYGVKVFALTISRDEEARFEQIFAGFNRFGIAVSAYIFLSIFILLWTLLLIIPGIIAAISYSMTFFILADDPNISAMDAIDKSKQMMDGYKLKYFLLCLIFGLLIIACLFTLGIGFLWLVPYMHVTFANFYNDIKENQLAENVKELALHGIELSEEEQQKIDASEAKRREETINNKEETKASSSSVDFSGEQIDERILIATLLIPPRSATNEITSVSSIFIPREGYFITPILLNINILVFILMILNGTSILHPDIASLIKWGANFLPLTLYGQWWRLLTCCFIHVGIIHLLFNMYSLFFIGLLLEPILGRARFISAYLLTGLIASVASITFHDYTVCAGASGAIFGMFGVFLPLLTTNLVEKRKTLLSGITVFVIFSLLSGFGIVGIDNAAHIGGFISGIIIGYAFIPGLKNPEETNLKHFTIGYLAVSVLIVSFVVCKNIPNTLVKYEEKMKTFATTEAMALEVFKLPGNTPKDKLLYGLKERGIYYWNQNIMLIDEVEKLNLPPPLHLKDSKLKQYCQLRIKSYELIYKSVEEENNSYKDQIINYNKQITETINGLKKR